MMARQIPVRLFQILAVCNALLAWLRERRGEHPSIFVTLSLILLSVTAWCPARH
jgi:hypothetical protein